MLANVSMFSLRPFLFFTVLVFCAVQNVWAIKPISGSNQKHYGNSNVENHWVILGAVERIQGRVSPEHQLYLKGKLTKWLWQIPAGHTSGDAFVQIKKQLKGAQDLFYCEGRECGQSNDFANKVFKQSILSGRDSDQFYWAGLESGKNPSLWLIYSMQRSNKGVYIYLERLRLKKQDAAPLQKYVQLGQLQAFFQQHYMTLMRLDAQPAKLGQEQVDWLKVLLKDYPNKKFALVVHRYGQLENRRLIESTQSEAHVLLDQMAKADGFIKNLYAHGAGAMMPREVAFDRIELVELLDK
jgi:hypothetical protein